jgi:hypothetical protein
MLKTVGFPSTRTGDQTIVDGNLVIGTSGKGIDFSATPGTGTSELFNDYEEGTWTPIIASTSGAITSYTSSGTYTKIGRVVMLNFKFTITDNGTGGSGINITGLPFSASATYSANGAARENAINGSMSSVSVSAVSTVYLARYDNAYPGGTNADISGSIAYPV